MNYFGMTWEEILNSPFQRLLLLANSIPKLNNHKSTPVTNEKKPLGILEFAKANNLLKRG